MSSMVATITIKLFPPHTTIAISLVLYTIWIIGILVYWYFVVDVPVKSKEDFKNEATSATTTSDGTTSAVNEAWTKRRLNKEELKDSRLPLTIVTGFLGSGKTTLVKNILQNTVGMKVLVIENEIGEEGIDHELLMQQTTKEEIILMNNGCVCCTGKAQYPVYPDAHTFVNIRHLRLFCDWCVRLCIFPLLRNYPKV